MRKMSLMFAIRKELRKLNDRIDAKIVKGETYERESKRHKDLVLQLRRLESEASFTRTFAFASFLF
jgi:hypothetical protein